MARPKGSKNVARSVELSAEAEIQPLIEYVGPKSCVQYLGVEFVQGVAREVPPEIFDALSTRAAFKVA